MGEPLQAAAPITTAKFRWGSDDLSGRTVAIQGCGNVGYHLARELHAVGAHLIIADIDAERVKRVASETGARAVDVAEIASQKADVFAPCALGGILNDDSIPKLWCERVASGEWRQHLRGDLGQRLAAAKTRKCPCWPLTGHVQAAVRRQTLPQRGAEADAMRRIAGAAIFH